jgi:hypothetical protein
VACAVGSKKGQRPHWDPPTLEALLLLPQPQAAAASVLSSSSSSSPALTPPPAGSARSAGAASAWGVLSAEIEDQVKRHAEAGTLTVASTCAHLVQRSHLNSSV